MNATTIAVLALAVSLSLLIWECTRYLLEGARVRVRMNAAALDEYSIRRSVRSWRTVEAMLATKGGWFLEAAEIEIENVSRSPLTVSDISLDFGRTGRFRTGRRTVAMRLLQAPGATTEGTIRLEPFDRCAVVMDVWDAVHAVGRASDFPARFPTRVRASVRVAGRVRRRRSPRRLAWKVNAGQLSFLQASQEIGLAAWQALFRHLPRDNDGHAHPAMIPTALAIREQFAVSAGVAPTHEDIRTLLKENTHYGEDLSFSMASWHVARDLAPYYRLNGSKSGGQVQTLPRVGDDVH